MITAGQGYRHCRLLVRKKARNFYYSFVFLPRAQRHALYAVYTFCHSCDAIADGVLSIDQKLVMLEEYRENLRRVERREYVDDAIFAALADAVARFKIPIAYFDELIDGVMMDLGTTSYETFDELKLYARKVAGVVGLMVIAVTGFRRERAKDYAETLGLAMQLTNVLRDLREDAVRHRVYLPKEDMRRFGYTEEELYRFERNRAFERLMAFEVERAKKLFDDAKPLYRLLPRRGRFCPRMAAALYKGILRKIEKADYNVFDQRARLTPLEKWTLAAGVFLRNLF